ncbi:2-keto-4-pentenoate hydratase [Caldimonas brevitalea]|uniref:Fumarylacetoacetate hydrolase n=1 Tax=Caldimonas brevitalea TaxID=413882 RepID=A0A0G3BNG9_9BURK|nr:fumarylacetoacetate hydrolase [Caldimonas brevitalea]AKJ29538.1 fumarylacetoacetate hydrolase [Caldimonas brevitalea]
MTGSVLRSAIAPWLALALALGSAGASAACPSSADAALLVSRYMSLAPADNPAPMSLEDAECGRTKVVGFLEQQLGRRAGYKAGLTNAAVQKRFRHDRPVRGVLFSAMLLPDGAQFPAGFGARPLFEADLLLRVKSPALHEARTPAEALQHLDAVIPFIELPDLVVQDPTQLEGAGITYINVGARWGVMGAPIKTSPAMVDQLANMIVKVLDGEGRELDRGRGTDVLGHPLNAVLWLAADVQRSGGRLQAGDLLSVGSFSKLLPPRPGLRVKVVYEGLEGGPEVGVSFR